MRDFPQRCVCLGISARGFSLNEGILLANLLPRDTAAIAALDSPGSCAFHNGICEAQFGGTEPDALQKGRNGPTPRPHLTLPLWILRQIQAAERSEPTQAHSRLSDSIGEILGVKE